MRKIFPLFLSLILTFSVFASTSTLLLAKETQTKEAKIVEKFDIGNNEMVGIYEDGRVEKVDLKNKSEKQLDLILKKMGFTEEDINSMDLPFKQELASNGGKKVNSINNGYKHSFMAPDGTIKIADGKTLEEVKKKSKEMLDEKGSSSPKIYSNNSLNKKLQSIPITNNTYTASIVPATSTNDGYDSSNSSWWGKSYVVYNGLTDTGAEYRYNFYGYFQWSSRPFWTKKDFLALAWGSKGTKYAPGAKSNFWFQYTDVLGTHTASVPVTSDRSQLEGTDWSFYWDQAPFAPMGGYGKEEIRVLTSLKNTTFTYGAAYVHPWYSSSVTVSFYGVGVTVSTGNTDKWTWDESWTIGY